MAKTSLVQDACDAISDTLVSAQMTAGCVFCSIVLRDLLAPHGIECKVVRGYICRAGSNAAVVHVWNTIDGKNLDVMEAVKQRLFRHEDIPASVLSFNVPEGCFVPDKGNWLDWSVVDKPERYWAQAPAQVRELRAMVERKLLDARRRIECKVCGNFKPQYGYSLTQLRRKTNKCLVCTTLIS